MRSIFNLLRMLVWLGFITTLIFQSVAFASGQPNWATPNLDMSNISAGHRQMIAAIYIVAIVIGFLPPMMNLWLCNLTKENSSALA